ncbi:hypothetical protein BJ508DRAFT_325759 [Ascobolus immersus RN42]|uniref:MYND-type domain-containing protein n=1 Tax=Ascobolus immersus RN42 TaxID=1160509 RepID=A0A3N4I9U2_ASCIM|nr:hypothetical protein BJ508DRAFT_325759 [Ascobolus immersus RN42]
MLKGSCKTCGKADVKLNKCGRCLRVSYCSKTCQTQDWTSHKPTCRPKRKITFIKDPIIVPAAANLPDSEKATVIYQLVFGNLPNTTASECIYSFLIIPKSDSIIFQHFLAPDAGVRGKLSLYGDFAYHSLYHIFGPTSKLCVGCGTPTRLFREDPDPGVPVYKANNTQIQNRVIDVPSIWDFRIPACSRIECRGVSMRIGLQPEADEQLVEDLSRDLGGRLLDAYLEGLSGGRLV